MEEVKADSVLALQVVLVKKKKEKKEERTDQGL
jgi:hypothetical protein